MATQKLVVKTDHSIEIISTYEVVWGRCDIAEATMKDGKLEIEWGTNGTDIDWDSQKTAVNRNSERIFLTEDGVKYSESEIELIDADEGEDEED